MAANRKARGWALLVWCGHTIACTAAPLAARADDSGPDWLHRRTDGRMVEAARPRSDADVCMVLQEDRPDGTELLTARYTLHDDGALRAYFGAGLNHARYFHDASGRPGPTLFTRRNRHASIGIAAELGAELQLTSRLLVSADLRWAGLDARAEALSTEHGPVVAGPVLLGLAVGYRFR